MNQTDIQETKRLTLAQPAIQAFRRSLQGELIQPGEAGYEEARRVWNAMIDKRPALIVRCQRVEDVIAAVNFARQQALLVAVRGGGHNVAGNATCEGGLVIDLSLMNQVQVDPEARVAYVQAGATLGQVDRATQVYGLATPTGNVSATGIAGLTLSGGLGWLRRSHGMSVDNLLAVDIVTADGRLRHASATENPDLFWGVQGGGGNFGVVTRFEFRLHEVGPQVLFLSVMYPETIASQALRAWRDWTLTAPDEASLDFLFWSIPAAPPFPEALHGSRVIIVGGFYGGRIEEGLQQVQPLRELGEPLLDLTGPMPYLAVQTMFDPLFPEGQYHYWKSLYLDHLTDEAIEAIVARAATRPSIRTLVPIRHIGGAISRVPDGATAVANRSAQYLLSIDSTWANPAGSEENITWTRQCWAETHRFSEGGIYLNFAGLGEEGQALVRAAHGPNYERLMALKARYDPTNLFRLNHNIKPAA